MLPCPLIPPHSQEPSNASSLVRGLHSCSQDRTVPYRPILKLGNGLRCTVLRHWKLLDDRLDTVLGGKLEHSIELTWLRSASTVDVQLLSEDRHVRENQGIECYTQQENVAKRSHLLEEPEVAVSLVIRMVLTKQLTLPNLEAARP